MNMPVIKVSELNEAVREMLERGFANVCVEGEISNLIRPASGHLYFSLKDDVASVSCALFKTSRFRVDLPWSELKNGLTVQVQAKASLYAPRGQYQLIVNSLVAAGTGNLERSYRERLERLSSEGLFALEHKKAIPEYPRAVGIITSSTGAAVHDVMTTLRRRNPALPIVLYPSLVQGNQAASNLRAQLATANRRKDCDLLLLVRGGGSLEDLWAFNDEQLARDIAASELPIISGVGHEIDTTLADFAADLRAPTPTAAAELATRPLSEITQIFTTRITACKQLLTKNCQYREAGLQHLLLRLQNLNPSRKVQHCMQLLDELQHRFNMSMTQYRRHWLTQLEYLKQNLSLAQIIRQWQVEKNNVSGLEKRLEYLQQQNLNSSRSELAYLTQNLLHLSPLAVLGRGYSFTKDTNGNILHDAAQIKVGDRVQVQLTHGKLYCTVNRRKLS